MDTILVQYVIEDVCSGKKRPRSLESSDWWFLLAIYNVVRDRFLVFALGYKSEKIEVPLIVGICLCFIWQLTYIIVVHIRVFVLKYGLLRNQIVTVPLVTARCPRNVCAFPTKIQTCITLIISHAIIQSYCSMVLLFPLVWFRFEEPVE